MRWEFRQVPKGYWTLVLHAHLPFVRHPEHEDFLEEDWFYEAITETYLPLIEVCHRLDRDGVPYRFALSLSPTLISMLRDPLLVSRYKQHLDRLVELASKEVDRTGSDTTFAPLARHYLEKFQSLQALFTSLNESILGGFKAIAQKGSLELLTTGATHGFFPLMEVYTKESIRGQVRVAIQTFEEAFGVKPKGFWLPECGFRPGVDEILQSEGIEYFFVDTHAILFGKPRPRFGVYAPVSTPAGVSVFGRDAESSKAVWSANEGYPGDAAYRDFYRDIGFDLPLSTIGPYVHVDGTRIHTGIKYYRVTGRTDHKEPYDVARAHQKAAEHAGNFIFNRGLQVDYLADKMPVPPVIVSLYDAELFGHWWYEGPLFLEQVFRQLAAANNGVHAINPSEYLAQFPKRQVVTPNMSSWGWKGFAEFWLNGSNDWMYHPLHLLTMRVVELSKSNHFTGIQKKAMDQAARELLLAQGSDWPFLLKSGTAPHYAERRFTLHVERADRLCTMVETGQIDSVWLDQVQSQDNLFPNASYMIYR